MKIASFLFLGPFCWINWGNSPKIEKLLISSVPPGAEK